MERLMLWFKMYDENGTTPASLTTTMHEVEEVYKAWMKLKKFGKKVEQAYEFWQRAVYGSNSPR